MYVQNVFARPRVMFSIDRRRGAILFIHKPNTFYFLEVCFIAMVFVFMNFSRYVLCSDLLWNCLNRDCLPSIVG